MDLLRELREIVGNEYVLIDELMSAHTTFKIGGRADYFVMPESIEQIADAVKCCQKHHVKYFILGNGSNLLVSDTGFRGVIIELQKRFNRFEFVNDNTASAIDKNNAIKVKAQAGVMLGRLGNELAKYSVTGFEFATGIPGTIGGAVMMNAGAYGGEIKDVLISTKVLTPEGDIIELQNNELDLGYRTSIIADKGYIVLEALMHFKAGSQEAIKNRLAELSGKRREKQPLEYPSAGSTFKRPAGYFAAQLIEESGLKGYAIGGARVSDKHAGFVVNTGNATAEDVINLTNYVKNVVKEKYNVDLELEVKKLGF